MFKRIAALTMALIMAIMPMTASAVTWSSVVSSLNNTGSYSGEGITATKTGDEVEISGTGTIEGDKEYYPDYLAIYFNGDNGVTRYVIKNGVNLNAELVIVNAYGNTVVVENEGSIKTTASSEYGDGVEVCAADGGYAELINKGTIESETGVQVNAGYGDGVLSSTAKLTNKSSIVSDSFNGDIMGKGSVEINNASGATISSNEFYLYSEIWNDANTKGKLVLVNAGDIVSDMYACSSAGTMDIENLNDATIGSINLNAYEDGMVHMVNYGDVVNLDNDADDLRGRINVFANGEGEIYLTNEADLALLMSTAYDDSYIEITNGGNADLLVADMYDSGRTVFNGDGAAEEAVVYINVNSVDQYTAEQLKQIMKAVGVKGEDVSYQLWTIDENGEWGDTYEIMPDGTLILLDFSEDGGVGEPELSPEQKAYLKEQDKIARANHERELKRKAEAIGGVTASPEWVKQLYLGYMSLNLRMYEQGEQVLFREKLAWAGDGTKNLTLRVNIDEPQALSIRLDEVVLDKLEQAEISLVTLLAKDSTAVMQYKVSDLRGAYEKYGLSGTDLLVVGGADDEVMKIGADGVMVPVETEAAEEAAAE